MKLSAFLLVALAAIAHAREPRRWFKQTAWERTADADRPKVFELAAAYLDFLNRAKTEREVFSFALAHAESRGFRRWSAGHKIAPGERLLFGAHGKILALVVVGERPLAEGIRFVGAHVDAVRIDLKPNPLYEDTNFVLFQTHYYGSLVPSQWQSRPLALHGVVIRKDGSSVPLRIGSDPKDPVLVIPDVLAHLRSRVRKEAGDRLPPEKLDPVAGSLPEGPAGPGRFKAAFLKLLRDRYGIDERDLRTAELSLVPASAARSVGLDGALVGGYGQDGRACAYTALQAVSDLERTPRHTAVVLLVDKEEIGSTGNTGMRSAFFRLVMGRLLEAQQGTFSEQRLREAMVHSRGLSADATSAAEPHFKKLFERRNAAFLGSGPVFESSTAHAEFLHALRSLLERHRVPYQVGEFSRVFGSKTDAGTILPYMTRHGMDAANFSIPVVSLHSPFEITAKVDLYWAMRAYRAFLME